MNRAHRMILWQLWRMTRDEIFGVIFAQYGLLALLLLVAYTHLSSLFHLMIPVFFVMSFFVSVPAVAMMTLRAGEGNPGFPVPFPLHLDFTQPVGTFTLVSLAMGYSCAKAAVVYLAVAVPVHYVLGQTMPLWPYVFWMMVMAALLQAAMWTPSSTGGRAWGFVLGVGAVGLLFLKHTFVGPGGSDNLLESAEPLKGLFIFTPAGYVGLGLLALGALGVSVASIERQRHGESLLPRLRRAEPAPGAKQRCSRERFGSAVRAQIWCEVRRDLAGPMLFPVVAVVAMWTVSLATLPIPREVEFDVITALWVLAVAGSVFITLILAGHFSGALRFRGGSWSYSTFEATLPIGTGKLTLLKVGTVMAGGLIAMTLLAAGTLLALLPHLGQEHWTDALARLAGYASDGWSELSPLERFALAYFAALWMVSAPLLLFSFGEASVAFPRRLNAILTVIVLDIVFGGLLILFDFGAGLYFGAQAWALAALGFAAAVWSVYRVLEREYLDKRLLAGWAALWALSVALWWATASMPRGLGLQIALLLMPLMALTLPPLALAANRHR